MDEGEGVVVSGGGLMSTRKCGRWNPTAEQVKVLTDLFRSGLRTPTTDQIQMISAHLSAFGKIESKNVFYWFQNHKARERHHKKRRRGAAAAGEEEHEQDYHHVLLPADKREARSRCFPNISCTKGEPAGVIWERREREIETLELFPLKSYDLEAEKVRTAVRNECKEIAFLDAGRDLPLDLRLSFL